MFKRKNIILTFMPFMLLSCGGGSNSIKPTKTEYQILSSNGLTFWQQGINFEIGSGLYFDKSNQSSYDIDTFFTVTEKNFDDSISINDLIVTRSSWITSQVVGESTVTVVGFGCFIRFVASSAIPNDKYLKGNFTGKFKKDGVILSTVETTLKFTCKTVS